MRTIDKLILTATLILLIGTVAKAQSTQAYYILSGSVIDSATNKPLDFVTISLKNGTGKVIKTTLSKSGDGAFIFDKLSSANYTILLASVGYNPRTISVELKNSDQDLPGLMLVAHSYKLKEVTVTADRAIIKQETDRISYDIKADPESRGSTVLEIMRKVPLLSVDSEDNLLMNGNRSYKILINGKPSGMMERNAKDILRSMPASSTKNVEVIFSPSSKYDAEGIAGIINIITDKKADNGYNGSLNISERFPLGGPGAGGAFAFKQGKFGLSALGGASQYVSPWANISNKRLATGAAPSILIQDNSRKSDSRNGYIGAELSYEVDSMNLVSAQFNISENQLKGQGHQSSLFNDVSANVLGYNLKNTQNGAGSSADAALNYQMGFKSNKARLLTLSYRYLTYTNEQINSVNINERMNYPSPDFNQSNTGSSREQTIQIDYVHPLKTANIEAGVKGIFRTNESSFNYSVLNETSGTYQDVPAFSNSYQNIQDVLSAYTTLQFTVGKWGIKAGARMENTIVNADFISSASLVKQNYLNIIPAVALSRKFKDMSVMSLTFTTRMQRPGITQLNPFVDRSNPDIQASGNPGLLPAFTNMIYLGYNRSKKTTVSLAVAYMVIDDLISPVSSYDHINKVTHTRFENINKANVLRSNVYISHPLSNRMNLTFNTDIRYLWITTLVDGQYQDNNGLMAYLNINTGYRFEKGWRLNGNLTMNSRSVGTADRKNGYTSSSLSLNKEVIKDKLTFTALINNPFTKYRLENEEEFGPNFTQLSSNRLYYRGFGVGLNYRFGKLKSPIAKNKRSIVNDDGV